MVVDGLEVGCDWAAIGTVQDRQGFMLVSCIDTSGAGLRGGPRCGDDLVFCVYWLGPNSRFESFIKVVNF